MAGSPSEDFGAGRSSEEISGGGQRGEALAEWRSSEQVEINTPSTSPPYWDTDDDDDDCGPKPSQLYGKYTWRIENFSQISKRELRSNVFEIGGYKWYILIYPQGCDVCNHLSLFLCVANHDKLLPGWSHFAQFTIAVVNKDPKKSKYSDTLHRFWKKEHDWGWKKFMELTKVIDGFTVLDTLIIKAQVQVIREKADRPFRCLDCQYRRELVRVYLTNVEQICRRFVEERRGKLGKLIEDKARWSSFCAFWSEVDRDVKSRMSKEKTNVILKVVVKHFFIEKEVTSTLVMDSLYSGLKALECQGKSKKGSIELLDTEETPAPIVCVEEDMFVLVDDVLLLLERASQEPLPPKDEKGPQNRTKDGNSGEDCNNDSIERDERRLTELGRRTVEIFVLAHIFSNRIEVAYQEDVALKRQEELIQEEEAAGQADTEQKSKRGAAEKEKRSKKKQGKHRRKGKDKRKDEKSNVAIQDQQQRESYIEGRTVEGFSVKRAQSVLEKPDTLEGGVSDTGDDVAEAIQPELEEENATSVNLDAGTAAVHLATEANSGTSGLPFQNGRSKKRVSMKDDSSSTCSTDSVPSVVQDSYKWNTALNSKSQTLSRRRKDQCGKKTHDHRPGLALDTDNQPSVPIADAGCLHDLSQSCKAGGPESVAVLSLKDRVQWLEHHLVEKEEELVTLQKKLDVKDRVDVERPSQQSTAAQGTISLARPVAVRETYSNGPRNVEKAISLRTPSPHIPISKPDVVQKPMIPSKSTFTTIEKSTTSTAMSRPSSAPLIPARSPSDPVVSMVQTAAPSLARSVSAAERLGTEPSPSPHSYVPPQSYRNAIMGKTMGASSAGFTPWPPSSSAINPSMPCSKPLSSAMVSSPMLPTESFARKDQGLARSGFTFGSVTQQVFHNRPLCVDECSEPDSIRMHCDPSLLSDLQNLDIHGPSSSGSSTYLTDELSRQAQGVSADDFPHLHMINSLFDEEHNFGRSVDLNNQNNGHHRNSLNRQFTFPGDMAMSADTNYSRFGQPASYHDDGVHRVYCPSSGPSDGHVGLSSYVNGHIDRGVSLNQWPLSGAHVSMLGTRNSEGDGFPYQVPNYSNMVHGVDGYTIFRPSNGQ